ncbi:MAG: Fis family transcriptional regulator, partial [Deltaproteobacteria bacterium]|nr:Fis family transcriptional regulator [Deltaproteobacteria bacterium]
LSPDDLPLDEMRERARSLAEGERATPRSPVAARSAPSLDASLRERIEAALVAHAGNQTEAARALGISRRTLIHRLEELGIARPRKGR